MVDVLYSLVNVNQRFDQLIFDPAYIHRLDLTSMKIRSYFDRIYYTNNRILDEICTNILPRISHQVNELVVEQYSMERIIHTVSYPQLYSLILIDFKEEILRKNLLENTILRKLLTEQIKCLKIDIDDNPREPPLPESLSTIFILILSLCRRLTEFDFCQFSDRPTDCAFESLSTNWKSSTLTQLNINVKSFSDCFYLLDGRLNCLSSLTIYVNEIACTFGTTTNMEKVPNLKHFTLTSFRSTKCYDNLIVPLLRRMINLEELTLYLSIIRIDKNYIDGGQLYDDILVYMPRLTKFTFNIDTTVDKTNIAIDLSSNEDIQRSFIRREYGTVYSRIDTFSERKSRCHIKSLPYKFQCYEYLNNSFQGGMFNTVRCLIMSDLHPFEHNFFKLVSQSFPLLETLVVRNDKPQEEKQQLRTRIMFPRLLLLYIHCAHADYAEQFLFENYCHLPRLLNLSIGYQSLKLVTNDFTNDATRATCSRLTNLRVEEPFLRSKDYREYFPLL